MAEKKTVFLTGASGHMGWAGFKELYSKKDKLNIVLLLRKDTFQVRSFSFKLIIYLRKQSFICQLRTTVLDYT